MAYVLILDDEKSVRFFLKSLLEGVGHSVHSVETAVEALKWIAEYNFDVVLSDIHMPNCTGLEFLARVNELHVATQVILMTGQPDVDTAAEAVRAGAFDYVPKPFQRDQLLKSIENAVRLKLLDEERRLLAEENERYRAELETLVKERTSQLNESKDQFKMLFEHTPIGICVVSTEGEILEANNALVSIVGYDRAELENSRSVARFFYSEAESKKIQHQFFSTGRIDSREVRFKAKDGSPYDVSLTIAPISFSETDCVLVLVKNISERKHMEKTLENERVLLDSIIENIPIPLVIKDAQELKYVRINREAEQLIGYKSEELIGKLENDLFSAEELRRSRESDLEAIEKGTTVDIPEESVLTYHNGLRTLHTRKIPIQDRDGRTSFVVSISEDITERKEFEKTLVEARESAEEMSNLKSSLLANISHELRTPLTGIIGFAKILASEIPLQYQEHASLIHDSASRLMSTLESVMSLSQLESGNVTPKLAVIDLGAAVTELVEEMRPRAEKKGLKLSVESSKKETCAVVDREMFHLILFNLVDNAIKFTERGTVQVVLNTVNELVDIEVRDSGIGIEPENIPLVFDAFRQESLGMARTHQGSGLGLTISKKMTLLMGGTIAAQSKKGSGSTFTVSFPLLKTKHGLGSSGRSVLHLWKNKITA